MSRGVVVTGGSKGIGQATVEVFRKSADRVVVLDIAPPEGADVAWVEVDVSDPRAVECAFERVDSLLDNGLDVVVANAGISLSRSVLEIDPEGWESVLRTNLGGVFWTWQQAALRMARLGRPGGVLLATASTNGLVGYPHYADYNASKAGVISLTRSFALEFAGVLRVNAVAPGYVLTDMQRREYTPDMLAEVNRRIPSGRHASPGEVADLFHFLASEAAAFITGQTIVIDGGETAGGIASHFGTGSP